MQTYNQKIFFSFNRKFCYKDLTSGHKINLRDKRTKFTREIDRNKLLSANILLQNAAINNFNHFSSPLFFEKSFTTLLRIVDLNVTKLDFNFPFTNSPFLIFL